MAGLCCAVILVVASLITAPAAAAEDAECAPFPDVTSSNQHCANIAWLKDQNITMPLDGMYNPTGTVNRGSMAAFLFRLTHPNQKPPACAAKPFPDVKKDHLFCGHIKWAAENKIAFGYPGSGNYGPSADVTRGAMAAFIYRVMNNRVAAPTCQDMPFIDVNPQDTFCGVIAWMGKTGLTSGVNDSRTLYNPTGNMTRQAMASFLRRADTAITNGVEIKCGIDDWVEPDYRPRDENPGDSPARASGTSRGTAVAGAPLVYQLGNVSSWAQMVADKVGPMFGIKTAYGFRDPGSAKPTSDHHLGLAVDFMIPNPDTENGDDIGYELSAYLQQHAEAFNVKYIIYMQRIWHPWMPANLPIEEWQEMEDRGSVTANHRDHVHLSFYEGNGGPLWCDAY